MLYDHWYRHTINVKGTEKEEKEMWYLKQKTIRIVDRFVEKKGRI